MRNLILLAFVLLTVVSCVNTTPSGNDKPEAPKEKTACDESPDDVMKVEWMKALIEKNKIEKVIRYDLEKNPVYFFKIERCCDHQSFLMDCAGAQICIDGGITGGTCKGIIGKLENEAVLFTIEIPAEDKTPASQPNK